MKSNAIAATVKPDLEHCRCNGCLAITITRYGKRSMSGEVSAAVHSWTSHKITTGRIEKKAKKVLEEKE